MSILSTTNILTNLYNANLLQDMRTILQMHIQTLCAKARSHGGKLQQLYNSNYDRRFCKMSSIWAV